MSRRRRDTRSPEQQARAAEWDRVEVVCTGRDTHARHLFARYKVHTSELGRIAAERIASLSDYDAAMLLVPKYAPDRYLVDNYPNTHMTQTFRCLRCARNVPFNEDLLNRRILALARHGHHTIDLSRLDRVRLP